MPGHERFVRTMISGATGIDAVLLVVAANEGIKPQTVEHIDIAGIAWLASRRRRDQQDGSGRSGSGETSCRRCGATYSRGLDLEPLPPVMTSAHQGKGIEELRQALTALAADQRPRATDGLAFLPIDRAFSMAGHGPVVTGTLRGATVAVGDTLELLPLRRAVRVRAVQVHGAPVTSAAPGQRVALNLRDVEIAELKRGMALAAPDTLALSDWLTISHSRRGRARRRSRTACGCARCWARTRSMCACACWTEMCSSRARPALRSCIALSRSRFRRAST